MLLATCMLHILPETREGMESAKESLKINWLAELLFCIGFFLVYLVEELVHTTLHCTKHTEELHRAISVRKPTDDTCNTGCSEGCSEDSLVIPETPETVHSSGHSHSHFGSGSSSSVARDFFTGIDMNEVHAQQEATEHSVSRKQVTFLAQAKYLIIERLTLSFFSSFGPLLSCCV